jgi:hypothetical protein
LVDKASKDLLRGVEDASDGVVKGIGEPPRTHMIIHKQQFT